jgi:hypothetical protein
MKLHVPLSVGLAVALCCTAQAQEPQTFGSGVTLTESTPLQRVLDSPDGFEGRTVRVEGTVKAVCAHMGCWMAFAPEAAADGRTLLIKVDDGVIVFPVSAKGRRAAAQGIIQRVGTADAEGQEAAAEQARATGSAGASAATSWQLKATGAIVY